MSLRRTTSCWPGTAQNAEFQRQTRQDLEDALVEREKLRQEVEKLQAASSAQREALEQLKQIRLSLLQEKEQLQKEKAQLLADRAALVTQARKAEQQLQTFERASREARTRLKALQARTAELEARLRQLEAEKRNLEGDIAVLVSPQAPASDGNRQLEALQRENSELKGSLTEVQRELQQLRERNKMLAASLDKSLYMSLLAEERVEPGNEQPALNEITRRVDNRIRLLGLRGVDVLIKPIPTSLKPGLLLARIQGIGADGRVRVVIEYRAREQAFSQGDVLASTYLILPASQAELRRRLDILSQNAENRLNEAGWVPEKLAKGGSPLRNS